MGYFYRADFASFREFRFAHRQLIYELKHPLVYGHLTNVKHLTFVKLTIVKQLPRQASITDSMFLEYTDITI